MAAVNKIEPWAACYVGLPFANRGRDWSGADCYGLAYLVYRHEFGIELPTYLDDYEGIRDYAGIKNTIEREQVSWIEVQDPKSGYLVVFRGRPFHMGVVVGPGWMLHVEDGINSVCEPYGEMMWGRRKKWFLRHPTFA